MGFLEEYADKPDDTPKHGSKQSLYHDKWDRDDWSDMLDEIKELAVSTDALSNFTPTGHEAMADTFYALFKANPRLLNPKDIRPSFMVNYAVMEQAMGLKEYDELYMYSATDEIASGLACIAMEPELQVLFDKLKTEQEKAQELEQQLQMLEGMEEQDEDLQDLIDRALEDDDQGQAQDLQDQQALLDAHMEALRQQIEQGTTDLQSQLTGKGPMIREKMKAAMEQGKEDASSVEDLSSSWGLDPGSLKRLPAERRLQLAKRVNNERFKRMADLIGPMKAFAMAEQARKIQTSVDEVYDLELGNNLSFVIPSEMVFLEDDDLALDFFARYYEAALMQYKLQGVEKVAKGGIIYCEDGSGSMHGDRELWAKAVGLALLQIAQSQHRDFFAVHFGGPGAFKLFDFDTKTGDVVTTYQKTEHHLERIDGIIDFAETFFNGGTCYMTPLGQAVDKLQAQFDVDGTVKGDIVFATDGQCNVTPEFKAKFADAKERLGFRMFGVVIGGGAQLEPLNELCDGRVWTIKDLLTGGDLSEIFREV